MSFGCAGFAFALVATATLPPPADFGSASGVRSLDDGIASGLFASSVKRRRTRPSSPCAPVQTFTATR